MIVVAVAAVVIPAAGFQHVTYDLTTCLVLAAAASASSFAMALFLRRAPGHDLSSAAMALIAMTGVEILLLQVNGRADAPYVLPEYAVVAVWILVQRLDVPRAKDAEAAAPPVRIFSPESSDQRASG
jgi:hypothetical protein